MLSLCMLYTWLLTYKNMLWYGVRLKCKPSFRDYSRTYSLWEHYKQAYHGLVKTTRHNDVIIALTMALHAKSSQKFQVYWNYSRLLINLQYCFNVDRANKIKSMYVIDFMVHVTRILQGTTFGSAILLNYAGHWQLGNQLIMLKYNIVRMLI